MSDQGPPRWAEFMLQRLLTPQDRETVTGDLREEYAESIRPRFGRLRAGLWYLRQVSSLAWRHFEEGGTAVKALFCSSLLTMLCGSWLAAMELLLRHPGFAARAAVALLIAAAGLVTLLVCMFDLGARNERWLWSAAAALIWLGVVSFVRNAQSAHFEGFVFVISIVLVLQGMLMLGTLGRQRSGGPRLKGA